MPGHSQPSHVTGDATLYQSLTTLARALAQYLVVVSKVPAYLHLPPEKEKDMVKFVVMTLEVRAAPEPAVCVTSTETKPCCLKTKSPEQSGWLFLPILVTTAACCQGPTPGINGCPIGTRRGQKAASHPCKADLLQMLILIIWVVYCILSQAENLCI